MFLFRLNFGALVDWQALEWYTAFTKIFFFFVLWLIGSVATLVLLKTKTSKRAKKYASILMIGVLYISIMLIRQGSHNPHEVITLQKYKPGDLKAMPQVVFKDSDLKKMNFRNLLRKRQFSLLHVQNPENLITQISLAAEEQKTSLFLVDLDTAFYRFFREKNLHEFWSMFSLTLINKLREFKDKQRASILVQWDPESHHRPEIRNLLDVLETIQRNSNHFNVILVSKSLDIVKEIGRHSASKIASVFRLTETPLILPRGPYLENKITGFEESERPIRNLQKDPKVEKRRLEEKERKRRQLLWESQKRTAKQREQLAKEEKDQELASVLKEQEEKVKKERWAEDPEKFKNEIDEEVERLLNPLKDKQDDKNDASGDIEPVELNEYNSKLLKNILKKTSNCKENNWVSIHEIEEFESDAFGKMIENKILDRIGDSIKFSDDIVYNHLSTTLLKN